MIEGAFVYILASSFKHLYVGVTTDLISRVAQHKAGLHPDSFTARYHINRLVYFERFQSILEAIPREKQMKSWNRIKKISLIVEHNPTWQDLSLP